MDVAVIDTYNYRAEETTGAIHSASVYASTLAVYANGINRHTKVGQKLPSPTHTVFLELKIHETPISTY